MKHKNLRLVCASASLCIASVLFLIGCMGSSAEQTGTAEFVPTVMEGKASDTLADVLNDVSSKEDPAVQADSRTLLERETEGLRSDEELKAIWEQIFEMYAGSDYYQPVEEVSRMYWDWENRSFTSLNPEQKNGGSAKASEDNSEYGTNRQELDDAVLDASEAGLVILREIDRLYPGSDLEHLLISSLGMDEINTGTERPLVLKWTGFLENVYTVYEGNYTSYYFELDAITGKISCFNCFYPYDPEKNYTDIVWTDEQILDRAKEVVEMYHLADGEELDWSDAEVNNATEHIGSMQQDLKRTDENGERSGISIRNYVGFTKGGKEYFNLELDFETGELVEYYWPDYYMM